MITAKSESKSDTAYNGSAGVFNGALFTDISPQEYIIAARLEYVRFFLKESDMSLEEIVNSVGYEHRNGLVTAFRKKFGMTPTAYRKAMQKTVSDSEQTEEKES